jgi:hypothetical protein
MKKLWMYWWAWVGTAAFAAGPGGMADGVRDDALDGKVKATIEAWCAKPRPKPLKADEVAVTLVDLGDPKALRWGAHRGDQAIYPASVVKLLSLIHISEPTRQIH